MITAITQFGDSTSGIGALGFDGKAFLIQLITFILALWVLKRYAFGPIVKLLNERRETIDRGVKLGEEMQKEKAELEKQVDEELHKARQEADQMIAGAEDTAREAARAVEEKAKKKADGIVAEAEGRIELETARVRKQLEKEMANLVAEATEAVIDEKVDAKKDEALIERAIKESRTA
ncbi:MAG TPA: F0F1 ATP synthase subunit B [Candidatus Saccharimonadales bacterium]|nr:F0F1 ATP synthase subunit B [Candidatus Saccharimonadales bacterium]